MPPLFSAPAVILAGGYGTRLDSSRDQPKPLTEIGGEPLLWHVIRLLGSQGMAEFYIALGFGSAAIKRFFLENDSFRHDGPADLEADEITVFSTTPFESTIHLVETGMETNTGGRIKRLAPFLRDKKQFLMTYADSLANIELPNLHAFHEAHGKLATVTAVRPPERFGRLVIEGDTVVRFNEKKPADNEWINGGFFMLHPDVLEYIDGDSTAWEQEPVVRLTEEGQLKCYHHHGFWACLDTQKEKNQFEALWKSGSCPWKLW
ncbi:glucose-1-phosphate cytidylyltransferase [Oceanidesulfovibrio indonesiensis]|uniref:Glucose-1-phosphate cytidylyltransferase n=1 Tax=Oceanidesulfovibrio indonesiensis TaxID=54767 RepID=A0A7M3MBK3_9BACT|nr:sugar phosphate nucleotidyltransferase [Oceanidesulfovibrio indonesiensis]TVM15017.1 glucose-1-phosphate cytidylyltransferase [Oceanidesulfovibrio indonesiensis]